MTVPVRSLRGDVDGSFCRRAPQQDEHDCERHLSSVADPRRRARGPASPTKVTVAAGEVRVEPSTADFADRSNHLFSIASDEQRGADPREMRYAP